MVKKYMAALMAVMVMNGLQTAAQDAEAAAAYDGTGVKPPEELLLQHGRTVGDIRLPKGTKLDDEESMILGSGSNTYGKIFASVKADTDMVVRFFLDNMPGDGWELISEYQSDDIRLTFQKPTRVVVMLIERGRKTDLQLTVTPRS